MPDLIKLNDAVEIVMPDGSKKVGLVQATCEDNGFLVFNPTWGSRGYNYWGLANDLKVQGAKISVIPCPDDLERYKVTDSKGLIL